MPTEGAERKKRCCIYDAACKPRWVSNVTVGRGYLFIKVSQPVHALELVTLEFAVEDCGLRNVFACMDGWVGKAVALSKPRAGGRG